VSLDFIEYEKGTRFMNEKISEEDMVSELLQERILYCHSTKTYDEISKEIEPETITIYMLCNDIFAWGCADSEQVTLSDLKDLYHEFKEDKDGGPVRWVCRKRNEKPQKPVEKWMREGKYWNDEMESLPENHYEEFLRKEREK